MNITQLNALIIKKDSNNRLYRGLRCFKNDLVLEIKSIVDEEYDSLDIYGKVMSESDFNLYNTNLSFDLKNNELIYTECNCADFGENCDFNSTYICKHIGATFYKFQEEVEERSNNKSKKYIRTLYDSNDYSEILLRTINKNNISDKEKASLQINLTQRDVNRDKYYYEIDLKIGIKKYYVVKNIAELIETRKFGKLLKYGKEFTYDPNVHYFSEEDEDILNFIEEYISLNEPFERSFSVQRITKNVFGNNKTLFIPQAALRRFFDNINDKTIMFTQGLNSIYAEVYKEDLPIEFNINEEDGEIKISSNEDMPIKLTYKGDVYLYNNKIYLPNKKQIKNYNFINDIFSKKPTITFKNKEKQEVFNRDGWIYIPYLILDTNSKENPEFVSKMENMLKSSTNADILDQMEQHLKGKHTTPNKVWELEDIADDNSKFHIVTDDHGNICGRYDRYILKLHMTYDIKYRLSVFSNNTDLYYKLAAIITDISILMKMLVETFEDEKKE